MKAIKKFKLKFFVKMYVVTLLGTIGFVLATAEPTAQEGTRWLISFGIQIAGAIVTFLFAFALYDVWGLKRVMNMLKYIPRQQQTTGENDR